MLSFIIDLSNSVWIHCGDRKIPPCKIAFWKIASTAPFSPPPQKKKKTNLPPDSELRLGFGLGLG